MKVVDPILKAFIEGLNKDLVREIKHNKVAVDSQYLDIDTRLDGLKYIDINNGDKRLVTEVVRDTHKELKEVCMKVNIMSGDVIEIKQATEIFIDFSKIYRILKKWKKVRWSISLIAMGSFIYGMFFK